MEKQMLIDTIQKSNDTQKAINRLENENRSRMVGVIVEILKSKGGKLTVDDWENVLDENLEITFFSEDGTYINNFCEINSIELIEKHNGVQTFSINCSDAEGLRDYELSYNNVCDIFCTISEYWQNTQR